MITMDQVRDAPDLTVAELDALEEELCDGKPGEWAVDYEDEIHVLIARARRVALAKGESK